MLLTPISTYMQNIICIILVHNLFLAANVCKYTVRYAVRLPDMLITKLNTGRFHQTFIRPKPFTVNNMTITLPNSFILL